MSIIFKNYGTTMPELEPDHVYMLWKAQPDNKLKNKDHDKSHGQFNFSFHHIQLDTTVTYSLYIYI